MLSKKHELLDSVKARLGPNYIANTDDVIVDILNDVEKEAYDFSHLKTKKERLHPYIKEATISEYNQRGYEGMLSRNEGGISSSFRDILEKMRKDIVRARLRRLD